MSSGTKDDPWTPRKKNKVYDEIKTGTKELCKLEENAESSDAHQATHRPFFKDLRLQKGQNENEVVTWRSHKSETEGGAPHHIQCKNDEKRIRITIGPSLRYIGQKLLGFRQADSHGVDYRLRRKIPSRAHLPDRPWRGRDVGRTLHITYHNQLTAPEQQNDNYD